MGVTRTALMPISTITMMYLYPCFEWKGKHPVRLEYVVFFASYTLMYTSPSFFHWRLLASIVGSGMVFGFVDLTFFRAWLIWPLGFSVVSG